MLTRLWTIWVPQLLFGLALFAAAGLVLAILLSPVFDEGAANPQHWKRAVAVCARDRTFRRIGLATAAALAVTAYVFFRPSDISRSLVTKQSGTEASEG